ncbi:MULTISPECIES: S26 family signal peptidase [unclassified Streptomyces]|uniref:S26 family signal peptidase n=1 Tax=unclassified Streptomyces TaxID=2593676 RepID=UPI002DD80946|nr:MULTISPECIES: S26 family signal peptidase [unclassified Streptomyces]WSA95142.1 S26 family signal peptidase [Streptomyces sp. NBC_01795]WSB79564.1 S26 family signal peptidase [Streptomyces sp. NBC_01775]WSS12233.1 S26 family signal peptidase [Streptomyces sp. NBC_01186]WSS40946.1 S26 family signal peptidase [Streptomyces sp. NBC_01187]
MRSSTTALASALLLTATATAGALLRRKLLLIRVTGSSMAPTFADGSRLLLRKTARLRTGDVIVFRNPNGTGGAEDLRWLVKRVTALPGDPVPAEVRDRVAARPGDRVPAGSVVVRGDAERTVDSRHFGYVPAAGVLGVVLSPRATRQPASYVSPRATRS